MIDLYRNIKKRREELRMTQTALADKTGYADKTMISKIEKGAIDLPQSKIVAFAKALRTTPRALMGWDEGNQPSLAIDEEHLIDNYRKLNDTGKEMSRVYVSDLAYNPKYTSDIRLIQAAHPRTDINIPDGANTNDDEFFD